MFEQKESYSMRYRRLLMKGVSRKPQDPDNLQQICSNGGVSTPIANFRIIWLQPGLSKTLIRVVMMVVGVPYKLNCNTTLAPKGTATILHSAVARWTIFGLNIVFGSIIVPCIQNGNCHKDEPHDSKKTADSTWTSNKSPEKSQHYHPKHSHDDAGILIIIWNSERIEFESLHNLSHEYWIATPSHPKHWGCDNFTAITEFISPTTLGYIQRATDAAIVVCVTLIVGIRNLKLLTLRDSTVWHCHYEINAIHIGGKGITSWQGGRRNDCTCRWSAIGWRRRIFYCYGNWVWKCFLRWFYRYRSRRLDCHLPFIAVIILSYRHCSVSWLELICGISHFSSVISSKVKIINNQSFLVSHGSGHG